VAAVVPLVVSSESGRTTAAPRVELAVAGDPDGTFGTAGLVVRADSTAGATDVAEVPGGAIVVAGGNQGTFQVKSFSGSGALIQSFNGFPGQAQAVVSVPGTSLVVAVGYETGASQCGAFPTPVVAEFTASGSLNGSFGPLGSNGLVALPCSGPNGIAEGGELNAVAIDPAGNIDVAGLAFGSSGATSTLVARVTRTGSLISENTSLTGGTAAQANALTLSTTGLTKGDIITAGSSLVGGNQELTVAAFTSTGCPGLSPCLDTSFGTGGVATLSSPGSRAGGVAIVSNTAPNAGDIVAVGSSGTGPLLAQFCVANWSSCAGPGALDQAFGTHGLVTKFPSNVPAGDLRSVADQPDGNTLSVAGYVQGASKSMVLLQYDATTGAVNSNFAPKPTGGGALVRSFGSFDSSLSAVAVDSFGRTIAAGSAPYLNGVQGLALTRVLGPTVSVQSPALVDANPITVRFVLSIDEPLSASVSPSLCTLAGAIIVIGSTKSTSTCTTGTVPAGQRSINVYVQVVKPVPVGQLQTVRLTVASGAGLFASPATSTLVIRRQP
jgi:hypothetical protein